MAQAVTPASQSTFSRSPLASTNGSQAKSVALVPTNTVNTNEGVTVRARIDPTLTVEDVVRQLCINLKIRDPPARYALRDEMGELVTNDNLRKKIKAKLTLKCVLPILISPLYNESAFPVSLYCHVGVRHINPPCTHVCPLGSEMHQRWRLNRSSRNLIYGKTRL